VAAVAAVAREDAPVDVSKEAEEEVEACVEVLELPSSCRRPIPALGNGGGSRVSKRMCPLLSSRLNSEASCAAASSITACDEAIESKDIRAMSVDNRRSLLLLVVRRWNS
jgi:hypothetical protein